jgi:hypothetical protein
MLFLYPRKNSRLKNDANICLLPEPEGPIIAVILPALISPVTPSKIFFPVGNCNPILWNTNSILRSCWPSIPRWKAFTSSWPEPCASSAGTFSMSWVRPSVGFTNRWRNLGRSVEAGTLACLHSLTRRKSKAVASKISNRRTPRRRP